MSNPNLIAKTYGSLREAFGVSITKVAKTNKKIVLLDGDLAGGTGAHHFLKKYPERFVQCGIAEQNMISVSAGMASIGLIRLLLLLVALRAFEQARLSISYTNLNVKMVQVMEVWILGRMVHLHSVSGGLLQKFATLQSSLVIAMRCFRLLNNIQT